MRSLDDCSCLLDNHVDYLADGRDLDVGCIAVDDYTLAFVGTGSHTVVDSYNLVSVAHTGHYYFCVVVCDFQ